MLSAACLPARRHDANGRGALVYVAINRPRSLSVSCKRDGGVWPRCEDKNCAATKETRRLALLAARRLPPAEAT